MSGYSPTPQSRQLLWPSLHSPTEFQGLVKVTQCGKGMPSATNQVPPLLSLMSFILCQLSSKCTNCCQTDPAGSVSMGHNCETSPHAVTFLKATLHFIRAPATHTAIELRGNFCWHCRALMVIYKRRNTRMATYYVQSLWMRQRKKDRKQCEKHNGK